jgi:dTDP-glucose pyrophosphorylase
VGDLGHPRIPAADRRDLALSTAAYREGYITGDQLEALAAPLMKSDYGQYLMQVAAGDRRR